MASKRAAQKPASPSSSSAEEDASDSSSSSSEEEQEQQKPAAKKPAASSANPASKPKPSPPSPSSSDDEEDEEDDEEEDHNEGEDDKKAAGGEQEEEVGDGGDEGEDSDSEPEKKNKKRPKPSSDGSKVEKQPQPQPQPQPTKPTPASSESGSSDGSGSDSESPENKPISARRPPRGADPSIKPISSRSMDEPPPKPKAPAVASPPPSSKSDRKRPRAAAAAAASEDQDGGGGKKRRLFERFWSEDDEVKILRGILDYHTRKHTDPSSNHLDMDALHDFLRAALSSEFSKTQLADKIRRLKKKYETTTARSRGGTSPNLAKPQERTAYALSRKIWGPKENAAEADGDVESDQESEEQQAQVTVSQRARKRMGGSLSPAMVADKGNKNTEEAEASYPLLLEALTNAGNLKMSVSVAKRALTSVESSKAAAMEEKFRKHRMAEMKHHLQWLELMKETVKLGMEALGKSG